MTLSERIASEIMDTIERERRINKDDLTKAVDRALQDEEAIVEILPSYFRPKPPPTRFGTPQK